MLILSYFPLTLTRELDTKELYSESLRKTRFLGNNFWNKRDLKLRTLTQVSKTSLLVKNLLISSSIIIELKRSCMMN